MMCRREKAAAPSLLSSLSSRHLGPLWAISPTPSTWKQECGSTWGPAGHRLRAPMHVGEAWAGRVAFVLSASLPCSSLQGHCSLPPPVGLVLCSPRVVLMRQPFCQLLFGPPTWYPSASPETSEMNRAKPLPPSYTKVRAG